MGNGSGQRVLWLGVLVAVITLFATVPPTVEAQSVTPATRETAETPVTPEPPGAAPADPVSAFEEDFALSCRAGAFERAAELAAAMLDAARDEYGGGDDRTTAAAERVRTVRRIARLPEPARTELSESFTLEAEVAALQEASDWANAESKIRRAIELRRRHLGDDTTLTADVLLRGAAVLRGLNRFDESRRRAAAAVEILQTVLGANHRHTGEAYRELANVEQSIGEYESAEQHRRLVVGITQRAYGIRSAEAEGALYELAGFYRRYAQYHWLGLIYRRMLANVMDRQINVTRLGNILTSLGRAEHAVHHDWLAGIIFEQTVKHWQSVAPSSHPRVLGALIDYADLCAAQGRYPVAARLYRQAAQGHAQFIGVDSTARAALLLRVAKMLRRHGRFAEAQPAIDEALRIRSTGTTAVAAHASPIADAGRLRGDNLLALGRIDEAAKSYRQALKTIEATGARGVDHPTRARLLVGLGRLDLLHGRLDDAANRIGKAAELRRRKFGTDHRLTVAAQALHAGILVLRDRLEGADALNDTAVAALQRLVVDEGARGQFGEPYDGIDPFRQAAALRLLAGNDQAALAALDQSCRWFAYETASAAKFGAEVRLSSGDRDQRDNIVHRLDRLEKQMEYRRSAGLETAALQEQSDAAMDEWTTFRRRMAERNPRFALLAGLDHVDLARLQDSAALKEDAAVIGWLDYEWRGAGGDVGVRRVNRGFVLRHDGAPVWEALPPSGSTWTDRDTGLAGRYREMLADPTASADTLAELGAALYAQRLEPLLRHLDGVHRLVVLSGGGPMSGVPVEALPLPVRREEPSGVVGDRYAVSYVSSLSHLLELAERGEHTGAAPSGVALTILADPEYTRPATKGDPTPQTNPTASEPDASGSANAAPSPPPPSAALLGDAPRTPLEALRIVLRGGTARPLRTLPWTALESKLLDDAFGESNTLLGYYAKERLFYARCTPPQGPRPRFIHLAAHALADPTLPGKSGVILAVADRARQWNLPALVNEPADLHDGVLDLAELHELRLDSELVVLSASRAPAGEARGAWRCVGVECLGQPFVTAGARTVVLRLWGVHPAANVLLMDEFYRRLAMDARHPVDALRSAQGALRSMSANEARRRLAATDTEWRAILAELTPGPTPFASPHYWASFVAVGKNW